MLSVVIPVWSGTPVLEKMHINLCKSVRSQCDELIVCEDGNPSDELSKLCDLYLIHETRYGHAKNLQSGIDVAQGDYIGVLDSDVIIQQGSMRDLCISGRFVSATLLNQQTNPDVFYIWCSVADKYLYEEFPLPSTGEILDEWAKAIPKQLRVESDKVTYKHNIGIGYMEWKKVYGK